MICVKNVLYTIYAGQNLANNTIILYQIEKVKLFLFA